MRANSFISKRCWVLRAKIHLFSDRWLIYTVYSPYFSETHRAGIPKVGAL
ncbi:hypothetical protein HMPREF0663_11460 [Hoylesella oralis ATCC 33269]|uniref:Uncharacterized protein n=1 Tax=Hoylesella oralis ATCC 33269 TaxID=873533 RepID=E7RQK9_9BACT|nr:hypothetical protein HMPREF0663_11460 [Hoylesella oralis ATCC 33269]